MSEQRYSNLKSFEIKNRFDDEQADDLSNPDNSIASRGRIREACLEAIESMSEEISSLDFLKNVASSLQMVTENPREISKKSKVCH